jgi:hypothetical protein
MLSSTLSIFPQSMLTITPKELSTLLQKKPTSIDLIDVRGT